MTFNIKALALAAFLMTALVGGCSFMNDAASSADLPTYSDIGGACEALRPDNAEGDRIAAMGNSTACEAFAGVEAYRVAQEAVIGLQSRADGSGDQLLITAAIRAGELEAKLSPIMQALNRSIDAFIYFSGELARYRSEGVPPPDELLDRAAASYQEMSAIWRRAQPILTDLRSIL